MANATRKFKSPTFAVIHEIAEGLQAVGAISKTTMRGYDAACLVPPPLSPTQIRALRQKLRVSQPVFASYLNTTPSTIVQWESGAKRPSGMGLKLLYIAKKKGLAGLEVA